MQLFRRGLDKFEEPLAPRRDMSTVLDIGGRPETLGRGVVPLVEERVERLQDEHFVLCFGRGHGLTPLGLSSGESTPDPSTGVYPLLGLIAHSPRKTSRDTRVYTPSCRECKRH